ncbi:hypothetical protein BKA70DRAFT_1452213 [Coprinopsis sp. MPI-PUGE-AT-0042]|nr:hypothetical protein BKA70DRAFT_1452213 [Coprinopsis sp. MPI-PUGE-AT-0042]
MESGLVIASSDGLERRFFPRIFTYSADYPEKYIARVALIKQNGQLPCPNCLMPKTQVHNMGTPQDITFRMENPQVDDKENRKMIAKALRAIKDGYTVTGNVVNDPLNSRSLLPIQSLVVDLMHEFEIGVWKKLYIHLLRLLEAFGKQDLVSELDERYRQMPSFGHDTIRKFSKNASECKRRAARDYKDLLQCSIAVFEGPLPPPHNDIVMELLFLLCEWHALAKLRMHHDLTLEMLEKTTITVEPQREAQARARRAASKVGTSSDSTMPLEPAQGSGGETTVAAVTLSILTDGGEPLSDVTPPGPPLDGVVSQSAIRQEKKFSLSTPKYHALGHYTETIRSYGTTDSFTSEIGETNHPAIKMWYKRTDRRNYSVQFAKISRQQARFRRMRSRLSELSGGTDSLDASCSPDDMEVPGLNAPTRANYYIGESKTFEDLNVMFSNSGTLFDPVVTMFIPQLKRFLLPRIQHLLAPHLYARVPKTNSGAPQPGGDWAGVVTYNNRIYSHQIMQVKYTTYDVRREVDIIRLKAELNVMVLADKRDEHGSPSTSPPYRYAQVLGIFHTNVMFVGDLCDGTRDYTPHRIDFLWVRWYTLCGFPLTPGLEKLHFEPLTVSESLGFLDPRRVLRAVHLTPQFSAGKRDGPKSSRWLGKQPIWNFYYINRFVDRDMYMRYQWKLAVGHAGVQRRYQGSSNLTSSVNHPEEVPGTEELFRSLEEPTNLPESDDLEASDGDGFDVFGGYDSGSDDEGN